MLFAVGLGSAQESFMQIESSGYDGVYDIAMSQKGEMYITGFFQGEWEGLKSKGNLMHLLLRLI